MSLKKSHVGPDAPSGHATPADEGVRRYVIILVSASHQPWPHAQKNMERHWIVAINGI